MSGKRVAIIGAGVAGLVSIKSCLEEGLEPVCFKRHDDIGGIWYYTEQLRKGQAAATYDSVVTNRSKEMSCFSDFPFPKEWPPFLSRLRVHDKPHFPSYPGLETFDGIKIHCNEYRDSSKVKSKRFLVVGAASTAGEVACELAKDDSIQVFLSMRHGTWVIPRIGVHCIPDDLWFSRSVVDKAKISKQYIKDYKIVGLQPLEPLNSTSSVMINDDIQHRIMQGKLVSLTGIERFEANCVTLTDGSTLSDIDAVVFATGYKMAFPFLKNSLVFDKSDNLQLYKLLFPVAVQQQPDRMVLIGMFNPDGPIFSTIELQARWAVNVFIRRAKLPTEDTMRVDIEERCKYMRMYHELAEELNANPSFWKMCISDPRLAIACWYGPQTPYTYRLQGSRTWDGAREAILSIWENTISPTSSYAIDIVLVVLIRG
uniref:Flavin-containing monooxygenase n=1 Tax=Saccoglossus kowalevskii TaxID=10224 RepID=A0ABM0M8Y3_SACKO|nr:PREDICTED: dimethylaniline monooxygenase [N-oxide-forming] 2-like [Saccoglossus kowalevskii]